MASAGTGTPEAAVTVTDVALRDGLQDEARVVPTEQKVALAERLASAGLTELEVGAFVRPDRVPQMADSADLLGALGDRLHGVRLFTLVFNERGARRAIDAGARDVRLVVSASDGHSSANAGVPVAEALDRLETAAATLVSAGVTVEGAVATAFVCPYDGPTPPERVSQVVDRLLGLGASRVSLADTIGAADPLQVKATLATVRDAHDGLDLGLHLHNTWGMAPAVVWQALGEGVRRFDAALGGIGGCPFAPGAAGNIGTDDLVHLLHRTGHPTGIDPAVLTAAREDLRNAVGHPLPSALATAGRGAGAESGLRPGWSTALRTLVTPPASRVTDGVEIKDAARLTDLSRESPQSSREVQTARRAGGTGSVPSGGADGVAGLG